MTTEQYTLLISVIVIGILFGLIDKYDLRIGRWINKHVPWGRRDGE